MSANLPYVRRVTGHLLYIVGEPGAGKSTLAAALTKGAIGFVARKPFAHTVWQVDPGGGDVLELGVQRAEFPGTDALSMSVQPKVVQYLTLMEPQFVFGEGDRLTTNTFFSAVLDAGYALTIGHVDVPAEVADERRLVRAAELGRPPQNPTWVQGRRTKVAGIIEAYANYVVTLDGTSGTECMLAALATNPVAARLLGKEELCLANSG